MRSVELRPQVDRCVGLSQDPGGSEFVINPDFATRPGEWLQLALGSLLGGLLSVALGAGVGRVLGTNAVRGARWGLGAWIASALSKAKTMFPRSPSAWAIAS